MVSLYNYWKDHPDDAAYIGKHYLSAMPIRIFLKPLEWIGLSSVANSYYENQYRKVLPSLNVHYLHTELNVQFEDPEWGEMFYSGQIPVDRAIFEVREAIDHMRAIKAYHEMRKDVRVQPLLTPLDTTAEGWAEYKRIREKTSLDDAFDKLALYVKGDKAFKEIDFEKLETYVDWLNEGILPPDADPETLSNLVERQQITRAYPWIESYVPRSLWYELSGSEPLSLEGAHQIVQLRKLIKWHKTCLLDFSDRLQWERRDALVALFLQLEAAWGKEGLARFAPNLFSHPVWQLNDPPLNLPAEGYTPETFLDRPEIKKLVRSEVFKDLSARLTALGGRWFAQLIFDKLKPATQTFEQDLEQDPYFKTALEQEKTLASIKLALVIQPQDEVIFQEMLQKELKSLPIPSNLKEGLFQKFLGSEYGIMKTCYERKSKSPLPGTLVDRLIILLPYSRDLRQVFTLFDLFCHKRAFVFIEHDQSYIYKEEHQAFIQDLAALIKPRVTPLSESHMRNTEKLILQCLTLILSGQIETTALYRILKNLGLSIDSLSSANEADFFAKLLEKDKEIRERKIFNEQGDRPLRHFLWLSAVKAGRVLAETLIVGPEVAASRPFQDPFEVLEKRYETEAGFYQTYLTFKKFLPTHALFLGLTYLHNGSIEELLTTQLDEATGLLQKMLKAIRDDLREKSVEEVIQCYQDKPFSHFPEGFIFPFCRNFINEINQAKAYEPVLGEDPPIGVHILKNISILTQILTGIEGVKLTKNIGNTLIKMLTPLVLQLTMPFCNKKEAKALTELIGIAIPHLLHNHDFKPLTKYVKKLEEFMKSKEKLTPDEEKTLIRETTHILDWAILQLNPYRGNVPAFIAELKRAFPR